MLSTKLEACCSQWHPHWNNMDSIKCRRKPTENSFKGGEGRYKNILITDQHENCGRQWAQFLSSPKSLGNNLIPRMRDICPIVGGDKRVSSGCPAGETMSSLVGAQFYPSGRILPSQYPTKVGPQLAPLSSKGCQITMLKATLKGRAHIEHRHITNTCSSVPDQCNSICQN